MLIGTNASNTSNQLDVIVQLRKAEPPAHACFGAGLSYGSPRYAKSIDFLGRALLSNWHAQFEHLPRQAYSEWLRTHSVLVMNNIRTQGTGVVVMALWYGLRIVVRSDAHIAPFLRQQGFVFDCIPLKVGTTRCTAPWAKKTGCTTDASRPRCLESAAAQSIQAL